MKNLFAALLLVLCAPALADHHVEGTYEALDAATAKLNKVQNSIIYMPDCDNWTDLQLHFANTSMQNRLNKVTDGMAATVEDLQLAQATNAMVAAEEAVIVSLQAQIDAATGDTTALEADLAAAQATLDALNVQMKGELQAARRHLTQPFWPVHDGLPNSVEFETGYLIVTGKYLVSDHNALEVSTVCPESSKHVAQIMFSSAEALRHVNLASWHISDSINELVYKDPQFICNGHGDNNHADTNPVCQ